MRLRSWIQKLLLLGISGTVCLLTLEAAVRWLFPFYNPARQLVIRQNAEGLYLGPANQTFRVKTPKGDYDTVVTFNQYGFWDDKDLAKSTPADLFVVGDSFCFGSGVDQAERFSDVLQRKVGRRVFNISVPGADFERYARQVEYARSKGAQVNHLIVGVCMENDLLDYADISHSIEKKYGDATPWKVRRERVRVWLKTHSAVYLALSYSLQSNQTIGRWLEKLGAARSVEQLTAKNEFNRSVLKNCRDLLLRIPRPADTRVLIIPSRALWAGNNQATERKVHDYFVDLLRQSGVQLIDMRPVLEASDHPLDFYFKTDPHWNVKGHALAAEQLARKWTPTLAHE